MANLNQIKYVDKGNTEYILTIPTNTSQLGNDSGFITTATANQTLAAYLPLTGGTLGGDLTLSNGSIAVGSKELTSTTITEAYANELKTSNGLMGSINITGETVAGVAIPAGWYNYIYTPHRVGGTGEDNQNYGTLFLSDMTSTNKNSYIITFSGGNPIKCVKLTSED